MLSHRVMWCAAAGATVLSLGCGSGQLPAPVYSAVYGDGLCGFWQAVDAQRRRWQDSGCEGSSTGATHYGQLSESEFEQLEAAFGALPLLTKTPCEPPAAMEPPTNASMFDVSLERWTPERIDQWYSCHLQGRALAAFQPQVRSILITLQVPLTLVGY